uniref:Uncharacterized protein n=2 Tax=Triticum urartu TaxID=4572 RepID=A0A8R7R1M0_TRIUA
MGMGEVERRGMEAEEGSQGDGVAVRLDELACGVRGQDFLSGLGEGFFFFCVCACVSSHRYSTKYCAWLSEILDNSSHPSGRS